MSLLMAVFLWGATNAGTASAGGGMGAGRVQMQDFHFVMKVNKASPLLLLNCATGAHIKKAQLTCRKAGGDQQEYLKVYFEDLLIASYQTGGAAAGNAVPDDQISFNFSTIKYEYAVQKADGGLGSPVIVGYDLKQMKKI